MLESNKRTMQQKQFDKLPSFHKSIYKLFQAAALLSWMPALPAVFWEVPLVSYVKVAVGTYLVSSVVIWYYDNIIIWKDTAK